MGEAISLWPLIGIAVIVVGFVLRFNPVLVVIISGIVTGVAAQMPIATILEKLGEGFLNTRNLPFILLLPLAVIGLLERHGLKERAQAWIAKIHSATAGRLLIVYLFVREATAALGLTSLGGHPQMVRPLLAPMAEGAAEKTLGPLPGSIRYRLRAMSAATDNVGLFFGEDIFVAFGAIALMPMLFGDFFKGVIHVDGSKHGAMAELAEQIHGWVPMALHGFTAAPFWLALAGVVVSYVFYMVKPEIPAAIMAFSKKIGLYQVLEGKYGVDWVYENIFARGARVFGTVFWRVGDQALIDGAVVNGSWKVVGKIASVVRWFQSGYIYHYALVMILGIFLLMTYFVWLNK